MYLLESGRLHSQGFVYLEHAAGYFIILFYIVSAAGVVYWFTFQTFPLAVCDVIFFLGGRGGGGLWQ